jgi:hypothetical protein
MFFAFSLIEEKMNAQTAVNQPELSNEPSLEAQQAPDSLPINDSNRCQHRFSNRTRCRKLVSHANLRFCPRHAALPENMQPADLTPELIKDPADLNNLDGIYDFLSRLIILQAQNRISTRRVAVLAYITNQLLRTFAAIKRVQADQAAQGPQIIFDGPRSPGRLAGGKPVHVQQSLHVQQMLLPRNAPRN